MVLRTTAILGLQGFFPLRGKAALGVGGMDAPILDRKRLAVLYVPYLTFEPLSKTSISLFRSRNWVCPRCEKTNLECLSDPTPGGPSSETVIPAPLEINSEVEVAQVAKDQVPHTTTSDSSQDHVGEPLPTTVPIVQQTTVITRSPISDPRPPLLLDTAICVLLVLALALLFRRFT
jgi:ubiquitin-conjugating enzyme E2 J1